MAGFLEQGLLDVLVALFRADPSLYALVADLLRDERFVVRLGATALVELLAEADPGAVGGAVAGLLAVLAGDDPTQRGDAAYLLGVVGRPEALPALRAAAATDQNAEVREVAQEAVDRLTA